MEEPLNIERDVVKNGVRLDCVFEGYEYRPEREDVRSQRLAGFECAEIAENTGLSLEQVRDYCRELGLPETGSCQLQPPDGSGERRCPVCGRILVQRGNSGRRRFCSPDCREEYYRQHKVLHGPKDLKYCNAGMYLIDLKKWRQQNVGQQLLNLVLGNADGKSIMYFLEQDLMNMAFYGGSSGALISMGALQMGLHEEELPEIIDSWREANPKIVQYWWDTEKAAMTAYKTGERQEVGKIAFEFYSGTLWMVLPSGRRLAYLKPRQQPNRFGRMSLTYEGVGQNHKWSRQETYSGRLVENATQAIARDILAEAMDRISAEGLNIVAHVHDEVIIEAPKDQYTVEEVCKLMSVNPAWCKGLPLAAAGYKGDYYFKD